MSTRILYAPTEHFIKQEFGTLAVDASAGSNVSLTLKNNNGLSLNDYIVVGYEGSEIAEMVKISVSPTLGTVVQVASLKLNHQAGEPVTLYRYNQRKFYGCATVDGSYVELTADGSPKDIQVDDPQGTFIEYSDDTYTYFKATYYNSTTLDETDEEDSIATQGDQSLRYATIYGIRKQAGLAGATAYSDGRIETKRAQAENEINSALYARYVLPFSEIPPILTQICELLAAGYIDYEEFGADGQGAKMLGEARSILKQIAEGKRKLIGEDYVELPVIAKANVLSGYPNGTTESADEARVFTIADKY